jgi:hypothetical protein
MTSQATPIVRIIGADVLRATVRFEDLIEPVARAFEGQRRRKTALSSSRPNVPTSATSMSRPASQAATAYIS